jgi:hypothetical protein
MMIHRSNITAKDRSIFHDNIYAIFKGKVIDSKHIASHNFFNQKVAIIGTDQHTVSQLSFICQHSASVTVYQIKPEYILPKTEKIFQRLIPSLSIKQQKNLTQRIKSLISLHFLDVKVVNQWLKSQLRPNIAIKPKTFLRSDDYYTTLQKNNCHLITWPIKEIGTNSITTIDETYHPTDIIIIADYQID